MLQDLARPGKGAFGMIRFAALLVAAGLVLGGCYISRGQLLDPVAARQPIPSGDYESSDGSARRLTTLQNGWYAQQTKQSGGEWGPSERILANSLGRIGGRDLYVVGAYNQEVRRYVYAVAAVDGNQFSLSEPDCSKRADAVLAKAWGARRETGKDLNDTCSFPSGRALKAALRAFAARADFEAPYHRR